MLQGDAKRIGYFLRRRFGDECLAPAIWRRALLALSCFGARLTSVCNENG